MNWSFNAAKVLCIKYLMFFTNDWETSLLVTFESYGVVKSENEYEAFLAVKMI